MNTNFKRWFLNQLCLALCACSFLFVAEVQANTNPPIGLLSFDTFVNGAQVSISWKTAAETNNDYFTVEKSTDGDVWEVVEIVKGAGTSPTLRAYNTIDGQPIEGRTFYRLKQTDFDGAFSYSKVNEVQYDASKNIVVDVFPNPATDNFFITGSDYELENIKLMNRYGQDLTSFIKIIRNNDTKCTVELENVTAGKYILKTKTTEHELYVL